MRPNVFIYRHTGEGQYLGNWVHKAPTNCRQAKQASCLDSRLRENGKA